ncbi:MAG: Ivy family c-type lysozyme inhibitor [Formosimonas sp.]
MQLKKITAVMACLAALPLSSHALQINNFDTLTKKQIEQSYFFDWNKNSTFRGALFKTFKASGVAMPEWLRQGGGGSAPAKVIQSGATNFVLLDTCKPRDCGNNAIYVLFDPASKLTAAVAKFDKKTTWIGKPNTTVKQILSTASGLR